jgi:hypothetical protein
MGGVGVLAHGKFSQPSLMYQDTAPIVDVSNLAAFARMAAVTKGQQVRTLRDVQCISICLCRMLAVHHVDACLSQYKLLFMISDAFWCSCEL